MRASRLLIAVGLMTMMADPAFAHHVMGGRMPSTFFEGLLSGLGHPVIGFDHLAAVVAVGCLAATQARGALCCVVFVAAMLAGAAAHVGELTVPGIELMVAFSVIGLGLLLAQPCALVGGVTLALFGIAGLIHGYALGESIAGAEPRPLWAYFVGLAIIQSAIAIGVMLAARCFVSGDTALSPVRLVGAGIAGVGIASMLQQLMPAA
jgi:urease accessory protein